MKKKITAALTAISIIAGITANFPASAEDVTLSCASYIQNMVNIEVTDKNGTPIEGAKLKLMDSNSICRVKFTGNTDSGYSMNDSSIKIVPYDDSETLIKTDTDILKEAIPAGHDIVHVTRDQYIASNYPIYLTDGETEDFTVHHCNKNVSSILTISPGTISIYADDAVASKKAEGYLTLNDRKYYFKDSTNASNNIISYPISEITTQSTFGVEYPNVSGSGGSTSIYPSEDETEYVKCRIHVSDLSERFNADGTYTLPADVNDSGSPITFDLKKDNSSNYTAFIITSGSLANAVLPDSNGYIEFYVEKISRKYEFKLCAAYSFEDNEYIHSTSRNDAGTFYYADTTNVTVTAPDFPETGTSLMYVPAGSYTIEAESLPDEYSLSEPMSINITDSESIQNFKIVLDDYEIPPEPTVPSDGIIVYPKDNIVDVVVCDYDGNLVTDAEIKINGGSVNDTFDSGGTHYTYGNTSPIKWFAKDAAENEMYMYIPFDSFKESSGLQNVFAMQIDGNDRTYYSSASISMQPGQTEKITMYTRESEDETSLMSIGKGNIGLYIDPKWEQNSEYTGYMLINDEPIYINPADGSGSYGSVSLYDIGEYTSSSLFGLCEPNTVPASGSPFSSPSISDETTEYVLRRMKLSEISDKFNADGTITHNDYVIDPRKNKNSATSIIFITSGAMVNAVIPDENGYVEFFVEKNKLYFYLNCRYSHYIINGQSSGAITARGVAAEKHTDYYTATKLPHTGALLTTVPAGEYTLTFTDLPAKYKDPGEIKAKIVDINGIQTIEINLEKSYNLGDVNENGQIDISDATLALREYALETAMLDLELTPTQRLAADVNEDGIIDISDATKILKYYAYTLAAIEVDPETIFKQ